ncbi:MULTISPECIES: CopM family metallochaperone [Acetobacterales]|jgi:uncharacterized protein (DUF305 family)|uniref:CopM family metallochaperone n=1 Tax=Acetobacterales TaxID=3120395 RepID=UPI000DB2B1CD|nr:DUF305 domain-containing protein [Roseomonas mucosa]MDT8355987.1 DUF305 domain-containing protein [Roseomonas mucosa]PZR09462.1 MAG: DUF305 domain-containing protein [Azospirillum brasilense]
MLTRGRTIQAAAAAVLTLPLLWSGIATAQGTAGQHTGQHGAQQGATAGYHAAMERMNRDMAARPMTGNADHDFASMMARHHQGAIDMARVELEHGRDPEMRRTAEEMIRKQEQEIAELRTWMSRHPAR